MNETVVAFAIYLLLVLVTMTTIYGLLRLFKILWELGNE
jgi:hypothetical protein